MVLQTARRADDDVGAVVQGARLLAGVHAADAGDDLGARLGVQPFQLRRDLQRQLARRGDGQHQRRIRLAEPLVLAQQGRRRRQTERHRLARSGLGRNQQVRLAMAFQHGRLDRRGLGIALVQQGAVKRGMDRGKGHERPGVQMRGDRQTAAPGEASQPAGRRGRRSLYTNKGRGGAESIYPFQKSTIRQNA